MDRGNDTKESNENKRSEEVFAMTLLYCEPLFRLDIPLHVKSTVLKQTLKFRTLWGATKVEVATLKVGDFVARKVVLKDAMLYNQSKA